MPIHDDETPAPANALSRDRRLDERLPWEADPPMSQQSQQIEQRIDQIHCRLLERATGGRLTWQDDQIVRRPPAAKPSPRSAVTLKWESVDKPLVGDAAGQAMSNFA